MQYKKYFEIAAALISLTVLQVNVPIIIYLFILPVGGKSVVLATAQRQERIPWGKQ